MQPLEQLLVEGGRGAAAAAGTGNLKKIESVQTS
jgi:hypothetical protein